MGTLVNTLLIKDTIVNIFILSEQIDPVAHHLQNAEFHLDRHVVKMITESCQMLSTALLNSEDKQITKIIGSLPAICKPLSRGMAKHPCTVWASSNITNFNYLANLAICLCYEHQYRYPLSQQHQYMSWLEALNIKLTAMGYGPAAPLPTRFVAATTGTIHNTDYSQLEIISIYRKYYVTHKSHIASWKKRMKPVWFMLLEDKLA